MGCTVRELKQRMTRREFWQWLAFMKLYPVLEQAPPEPSISLTPEQIQKAIDNRT